MSTKLSLRAKASVSKHNIITLPVELTQRIAQHADPQDLCALRLVNKETASRVMKAFTEVHFTKRAFLLYKDSLQTLLEIASSKHFGQHLKKVVLCVEEVPPVVPPEVMEILEGDNNIFQATVAMLSAIQPQKAEAMRNIHEQMQERSRSQDGSADLSVKKELNALTTKAWLKPRVIPHSNADNFVDILIAVANANFRVTELDLCPGQANEPEEFFKPAVGVPLYTVARVPRFMSYIATVFQHFRKLKLNVCETEEHNYENAPHRREDYDNMADVFKNMPHLEELYLRQDFRNGGQEPSGGMGKPFLSLRFPSLRRLSFQLWEFGFPDLRSFIPNQPVLEKVVAQACEFELLQTPLEELDDGTVDTVARRLREGSRVQEVVVWGGAYCLEENYGVGEGRFSAASASTVEHELKESHVYEVYQSL